MTLADGKIVCALEGGYIPSVLAKCVQSVLSNLLDRSSPEISDEEAKQDEKDCKGTNVLDTIDAVAANNILFTIAEHKPYWACLRELS
jgi:histone deacetylase 6